MRRGQTAWPNRSALFAVVCRATRVRVTLTPPIVTRRHLITACVIAAGVFAILAATVHRIGLTWDEPVYMNASRAEMDWIHRAIRAPQHELSERATTAWHVDIHPPLDQVWTGLVASIVTRWTDDETAHRAGNML